MQTSKFNGPYAFSLPAKILFTPPLGSIWGALRSSMLNNGSIYIFPFRLLYGIRLSGTFIIHCISVDKKDYLAMLSRYYTVDNICMSGTKEFLNKDCIINPRFYVLFIKSILCKFLCQIYAH